MAGLGAKSFAIAFAGTPATVCGLNWTWEQKDKSALLQAPFPPLSRVSFAPPSLPPRYAPPASQGSVCVCVCVCVWLCVAVCMCVWEWGWGWLRHIGVRSAHQEQASLRARGAGASRQLFVLGVFCLAAAPCGQPDKPAGSAPPLLSRYALPPLPTLP
jgi:hypothetical protein